MEQRGVISAWVARASSEAGGATCTAFQHLLGGGTQVAVLCPHMEANGSFVSCLKRLQDAIGSWCKILSALNWCPSLPADAWLDA